MPGIVYIVGAGPGDPRLLTIAGRDALRHADVVLYDRLVGSKILKFAPKASALVPVGKVHGKNPDEQQDHINSLMLEYFNEDKTVVRLKGGDPFLFARGGEEVLFLLEHGVIFKVIPGVSSITGVTTSALVPLTMRGISSSLLVVPGHVKEGYRIDWKSIACFSGTIVVLMGGSIASDIATYLICAGKAEKTPMCIIEEGTMEGQKVTFTELGEAARNHIRVLRTSLIIVGEVLNIAMRIRKNEK